MEFCGKPERVIFLLNSPYYNEPAAKRQRLPFVMEGTFLTTMMKKITRLRGRYASGNKTAGREGAEGEKYRDADWVQITVFPALPFQGLF